MAKVAAIVKLPTVPKLPKAAAPKSAKIAGGGLSAYLAASKMATPKAVKA